MSGGASAEVLDVEATTMGASFRYRRSARIGRGAYVVTSYSGADAALAMGAEAAVGLTFGLLSFALTLAWHLAVIVAVLIVAFALVMLRLAILPLRVLLPLAFKGAWAAGKGGVRLTGQAARIAASTAQAGGAGVASSGVLDVRWADVRARLVAAWACIRHAYVRLPEWGKPMAWGIVAAAPLVLVMFAARGMFR